MEIDDRKTISSLSDLVATLDAGLDGLHRTRSFYILYDEDSTGFSMRYKSLLFQSTISLKFEIRTIRHPP